MLAAASHSEAITPGNTLSKSEWVRPGASGGIRRPSATWPSTSGLAFKRTVVNTGGRGRRSGAFRRN
ncbi:hypothetical protein KRMM14A1004_61230 [Krasilnikovia sp. MM14-A1004]